MRLDLALAILLLLGSVARADVDGSHPLTNRPFPLREIAPSLPAALLVWHPDDGPTKRKLGEAKLLELVASRPTLTARSLQVRSPKPVRTPPYGGGALQAGWLEPARLSSLQIEETPFIVTIDPAGLVHRLSYFDHWPVLSVVESRFGPMPAPSVRPWWKPFGR